eukprot:TRINITY_DN20201_c0_g1_i1.p1 TRINITY_DN20201_c0_g1~~TRINITY_DN20201_c0_g1_i1.p1  ORF type:complete len:109 (+),score=16.56 TRINITY_DN20201_c0_g1_i1:24-350(+)
MPVHPDTLAKIIITAFVALAGEYPRRGPVQCEIPVVQPAAVTYPIESWPNIDNPEVIAKLDTVTQEVGKRRDVTIGLSLGTCLGVALNELVHSMPSPGRCERSIANLW